MSYFALLFNRSSAYGFSISFTSKKNRSNASEQLPPLCPFAKGEGKRDFLVRITF
jgi:hypothetical protein